MNSNFFADHLVVVPRWLYSCATTVAVGRSTTSSRTLMTLAGGIKIKTYFNTLTERNAYIQMTLGIILAIPTFMMPTKAGAAVRYLKITADQQIITFSTLAE